MSAQYYERHAGCCGCRQESFKKFVGALITRRNHWNDLYYRDDPTILGWELANEPHMPGDDTGNVLKVLSQDRGVTKPSFVGTGSYDL